MPTLGSEGDAVGALPFSDVNGLLSASAAAEKQQAVVAHIIPLFPKDPTPSSSDTLARLVTLRNELDAFIGMKSNDTKAVGGTYIWHKEAPSISISQCSDQHVRRRDGPPLDAHLILRLRTGGDCVEDEWFVTYLLLEATKRFVDQQLVVSIENEEGQFLLIEAAAQLPSWITPENAPNRVWIYNGQLHLNTPHLLPQGESDISRLQAVAHVRDPSVLTRAPEEMETVALARVYDYPRAAADSHHQTLAYLPRSVAQLLIQEPQFIATCISATQSRDVMSSRASSKMLHFPPPSSTSQEPASVDSDQTVILTPVRMTRYLYAQLLCDRFFPPRQLGRTWQATVEQYRMKLHQRSVSAADRRTADLLEGRWRDLGAKIWCGMEMAYDESLSKHRRANAAKGTFKSAKSETERTQFISTLTKLGYFGDEIEGSARWKALESEAIHLCDADLSINGQSAAQTRESVFSEVVNRLRKQPFDSSNGPISTNSAQALLSASKYEDSDEWLYLTEEDLDEITASKADPKNARSGSREDDAFKQLDSFTAKMDNFMTTRSDAQGALFEDEVDVDEELSDDDLLFEELDEDEQERRVQREVQQRIQQTTPEERLKFLQTLIPRMTQEEWATKPAPSPIPFTEEAVSAKSMEDRESAAQNTDFAACIDQFAAERSSKIGHETDASISGVVAKVPNLTQAEQELQRRIASQYMRQTSAKLSTQPYEGASDPDEDELEQETSPELRRQIAKEYDLELDDDAPDPRTGTDDEDMLDAPELNDEDEMENLLEFARTSLGLSKQQYEKILQDRAQQGKFVPTFKKTTDVEAPTTTKASSSAKSTSAVNEDALPRAEKNGAKLDTFESLMEKMDESLEDLQRNRQSAPAASSAAASSNDIDADGKLNAEEQELLAHLLKSGGDLPSSLWSQLSQGKSSKQNEDMIKAQQASDFLKSFQAQPYTTGPGSSSGPVETLMRRFGLGSLPADSDT